MSDTTFAMLVFCGATLLLALIEVYSTRRSRHETLMEEAERLMRGR